jgi:hypothetical protein
MDLAFGFGSAGPDLRMSVGPQLGPGENPKNVHLVGVRSSFQRRRCFSPAAPLLRCELHATLASKR